MKGNAGADRPDSAPDHFLGIWVLRRSPYLYNSYPCLAPVSLDFYYVQLKILSKFLPRIYHSEDFRGFSAYISHMRWLRNNLNVSKGLENGKRVTQWKITIGLSCMVLKPFKNRVVYKTTRKSVCVFCDDNRVKYTEKRAWEKANSTQEWGYKAVGYSRCFHPICVIKTRKKHRMIAKKWEIT